MADNQKPQTKKKRSWLATNFSPSKEDIEFQVENHDTLPIWKTARGGAVLTMVILLLIGIALGILFITFLGSVSLTYSSIIGSSVIYVILLYFVYLGNRWGMVLLMIYYTVDKVLTALVLGHGINVSSIIFWLIGIGPLWYAFRVENEYRRRKTLTNL